MVHFPADAVKGSTGTYCVNSGKRVKIPNSDEAQPNDEIMRHQTERDAQWIPACLLEIISGQIITTTLGSKHKREMIKKALRLPAGNYDLIEKEGLEIIGVKTQSGQEPLVSHVTIIRGFLTNMTDMNQGIYGLRIRQRAHSSASGYP